MGAQGGHAGTTPDVDRFLLRGLEMEIAERPGCRDNIAGLETESIGGANPRRAVSSGRRCSNTDVEAQRSLGDGVTGQGIVVTPAGGGIAGDERKQILLLPNTGIGLRDIKVAEPYCLVRWNFELQVVSRCEVNLPGNVDRLENQLLDECGNRAV